VKHQSLSDWLGVLFLSFSFFFSMGFDVFNGVCMVALGASPKKALLRNGGPKSCLLIFLFVRWAVWEQSCPSSSGA